MILKLQSLFGKKRERSHSGKSIKGNVHPPDYWLIISIVTIAAFGILMVYDSSVAIAIRDFSDQYYFVRQQALWLFVGIVCCVLVSKVNYHRWYALALPFFILTLILLSIVFIPGIGIRALGAHRWISFGPLVIQPAELAKLSLVIYLSAWLSFPEKNRIVAFLILLFLVVGLVVIEPDLGTSFIILTTALLLYFLSGAPMWQFLVLVPLFLGGAGALAVISPYRLQRLTTFLNPDVDPLGSSYHIRQILLSLGSGGLFGMGIGQSRQKYMYLPEANTDSIFAIIAEEVGFLGASALVALFLFLIWRGFRIARRAPDRFGRLLALGISSWIGLQTVVNLAAMVSLIPLTGVPLPLISYGGSSLVITLVGLGILLNISTYATST